MKVSLGKSYRKDCVNYGVNYKSALSEIDDGECTEIHAPEVLDYIPQYDFDSFMDGLVNKMRHGCELTLGGSDIMESAKQLLRGDRSIYNMNQALYGDKDIMKLGQYSLHLVSEKLLQRGLKILEKNIDHNQMYVKAIRE